MSENALIAALDAEAVSPAAPAKSEQAAATQISQKMTPRANSAQRSERQAARAEQAQAEKAAPRLSRSERLAAEQVGMSADEVLAAERRDDRQRPTHKDALSSERQDLRDPEDEADFKAEADEYDRSEAEDEPEQKAAEDDEDPILRDPNKADPDNQYGLPEEVEYTDKSGKQYKLPRELVEGAIRQADYTRSKQEVAELRRVTIAERARVQIEQRIATELAPALATVNNLRTQIEADRAKLPDPEADPLGYIKLDKQIRDREAAATQLERAIADKRTEFLTQQQSVQTELLHSGVEWLRRTTRGNWNLQVQQQVGNYAVAQGFTPEELTANFDPRFVLMAYKAMQYDRRQAAPKSPPAEKRQAPRAQPIAKTSSPPVSASRAARDPRIDQLRTRARSSGNVNDAGDAIAALLDRSRRR